MIISASSDEFMMQENTRAFFKDLSIQTSSKLFLRRLENSNHYLTFQTDKIFVNINNFYYLITQVN
jgi:PhoPQ-activated pathogenicity-related protein